MIARLAILAVVVALVFSNTLHNALHLDDIYRIQENHELERVRPLLRHLVDPYTSASLPHLAQYRPLLPMSLSLNHAISDAVGLDRLVGLHIGNIALHFGVCAMLLGVFANLAAFGRTAAPGRTPAPPTPRDLHIAFGATLLFAVHPIAGVPVNYVCSRDLLMMMLLLMASLLAYLRMRRSGDTVAGWIGVLTLYTLSMLAKQNGVVAPVLIGLVEWLVVRPATRSAGGRAEGRAGGVAARIGSVVWRPLLFVTVPVGFFIWTIKGLAFSDLDQLDPERGSAWAYALTMAKVHVFHYARNVVWPFAMRPLPRIEPGALSDPRVLIGGVLIVATIVIALVIRRRRPLIAFSILSYWTLFAPTSSIRPFRSAATDYRQYPSFAFGCLIVVLLLAIPGALTTPSARRRVAVAVLFLATLAGAATFFHTNRVWRTERSLWAQSVRYGGTALAHLNYGRAIQGIDPASGEQHYRAALALEPNHVYTHINLGLLLINQGRADTGLEHVHRAVTIAPDWGLTHYWLAQARRTAGDVAGAQRASADAANLDQRNITYQYQAAVDLQNAGKLLESIPYLQRITSRDPDYRDAAFREAYALHDAGDWVNAEVRYRRFLEGQPDHVQARFNLAHGLMESGAHAEAIEHFGVVLRLDPDRSATHHWLAQCYEATGRTAEAEHHAAQWERAQPE